MTLVEELRGEACGEIEATKSYRSLAVRLRKTGHYNEGNLVDSIADDEDRHANLLVSMANSILSKGEPAPEPSPQRRKTREILDRISQPFDIKQDRPFPKTYGDWVELGVSIKERVGIDDFATTAQVNIHLNHIYEEEQDPTTAQVSRRWLTDKARQLGVE